MKAHAQRLAALLFAVIIGSAALQLSGVASADATGPKPDQGGRSTGPTHRRGDLATHGADTGELRDLVANLRNVDLEVGVIVGRWNRQLMGPVRVGTEHLRRAAEDARVGRQDQGRHRHQSGAGDLPARLQLLESRQCQDHQHRDESRPQGHPHFGSDVHPSQLDRSIGLVPIRVLRRVLEAHLLPRPDRGLLEHLEGTRKNTTKSLTSVPAGCGGGAVQPQTQYQVGVRTIQQTGAKPVWTTVRVATATTPSALPAHCQSTDELFCTDFPNGFVKTAAWPAAPAG
jgi:hypothetical protein